MKSLPFFFSAQEIVNAIKSTVDLKALRLEGNTLGLEAAKAIAEALKGQKSFEVCVLSKL